MRLGARRASPACLTVDRMMREFSVTFEIEFGLNPQGPMFTSRFRPIALLIYIRAGLDGHYSASKYAHG